MPQTDGAEIHFGPDGYPSKNGDLPGEWLLIRTRCLARRHAPHGRAAPAAVPSAVQPLLLKAPCSSRQRPRGWAVQPLLPYKGLYKGLHQGLAVQFLLLCTGLQRGLAVHYLLLYKVTGASHAPVAPVKKQGRATAGRGGLCIPRRLPTNAAGPARPILPVRPGTSAGPARVQAARGRGGLESGPAAPRPRSRGASGACCSLLRPVAHVPCSPPCDTAHTRLAAAAAGGSGDPSCRSRTHPHRVGERGGLGGMRCG